MGRLVGRKTFLGRLQQGRQETDAGVGGEGLGLTQAKRNTEAFENSADDGRVGLGRTQYDAVARERCVFATVGAQIVEDRPGDLFYFVGRRRGLGNGGGERGAVDPLQPADR